MRYLKYLNGRKKSFIQKDYLIALKKILNKIKILKYPSGKKIVYSKVSLICFRKTNWTKFWISSKQLNILKNRFFVSLMGTTGSYGRHSIPLCIQQNIYLLSIKSKIFKNIYSHIFEILHLKEKNIVRQWKTLILRTEQIKKVLKLLWKTIKTKAPPPFSVFAL